MQLVHAANGGDHALFEFALVFSVFNDLLALVFAGLFNASEHWGAS
jgi:hypothetical protein